MNETKGVIFKNLDNDGENLLLEEEPAILEEIQIEELAIDGICGVY